MSYRVTTYYLYNNASTDMARLQSQINRSNEQISSGKSVLSPSDDPVASARILQLDNEINQANQYQKNITLVDSRLKQEEGVLQAVEEVIDRVRELAVKAGNSAVLTSSEREAIAVEVQERFEELVDLMNSKDGSGEYLFSGFAGDTEPFQQSAGGGIVYKGDEGQRMLQISSSSYVASSDSGKDAFVSIDSSVTSFFTSAGEANRGNATISSGFTLDQEALDAYYPEDVVIVFENPLDVSPAQSNFSVVRESDGRVIDGLEHIPFTNGDTIEVAGVQVQITGEPKAGDRFTIETSNKQALTTTIEKFNYALTEISDSAEYADAYASLIAETLDNLDNAIDNLSSVRAKVGARLNTTETTQNMHADNILAAQSIQSQLSDLDYAAAVSTLEMQTFVLEATQSAFVKISSLSLFNYIS
ncbi:flagellar hook-associated protein FlgL [Gynuella sunshinyii]|uniref:Flagellin and related hook-associated protein n=1 Tax=Gynuella sunshinyii YC6258 TaxID=1445510 RepID=A0A0C5V9M1_9GAMM|nr:flagellar hook-associated protein FlgL [Gynuella sunshinyii]AJQ96060.1 flagellin and related hook-associated protein [Gynuella sunshinyii YC6258]